MEFHQAARFSILFMICTISAWQFSFGQATIQNSESVFLFTEFTEGTIINESGQELTAMLNYHMVEGKMYISKNNIKLRLNNKTAADTIIIDKRVFVAKNNVYYELLLVDPVLFREHRKKITESGIDIGYGTTSKTTGSTSINFVAHDDENIPEGMKLSEYSHYHIMIEEELIPFRSFGQFQKLFPNQRKEVKNYIREQNLEFETEKDMIQLVLFVMKNQ